MTDQDETRGALAAHPNSVSRIVRLPEVKSLTGLSRSTVYERVREGRFPKPINLDGRNVGWLEREVQGWIDRRVAESRV